MPHCTTRFTVVSWPPMESFSGCVPVGASAGIDTFTWYNPTMPGVKPLKMIPSPCCRRWSPWALHWCRPTASRKPARPRIAAR